MATKKKGAASVKVAKPAKTEKGKPGPLKEDKATTAPVAKKARGPSRIDVTIEMLTRKTGVTREELATAFKDKFGTDSKATVNAALSKVPKAKGLKVTKEESKTRGMVYRAAA